MLGTLCKSRITCANSTQYSEEVSDLLLNCFCIFRLQHTLQRVSLLRLCRSVWSCSRSILGYSVYQRFPGVTGLQCPGPNDLCRVRSLRELDRNLVEESVALLKRAVHAYEAHTTKDGANAGKRPIRCVIPVTLPQWVLSCSINWIRATNVETNDNAVSWVETRFHASA